MCAGEELEDMTKGPAILGFIVISFVHLPTVIKTNQDDETIFDFNDGAGPCR